MRRVKKTKYSWKAKLYGLLGILAVAGIVSFVVSPYGEKTVASIRSVGQAIAGKAHLVLDQVHVEGHARTSLEDINRSLNLAQDMPILDVDLNQAREKLLLLPWVKSAVIERHLPSTLFIRIVEKEPIAVWQHNKKYLPLDTEGQPIQDDKTALPNLVLVVGADAPEHTPALIEVLNRYPELYAKVRSAVRQGERRWDLILNDVDDGLVIQLPETEIEEALHRLQQADERDGLMKKNMVKINLRHKDRLIVRPKEVR